MLDVKANADGQLVLGKTRREGDLDREKTSLLGGGKNTFDFIVSLNSTAWKHFNEKQREAVMFHCLCFGGVARDRKTDEVMRDERDRIVYRIKKEDVREFAAVIRRFGLYTHSLQQFAKAIEEAPLFKDLPDPPPTKAPEKNPNEQDVPNEPDAESNGKVNGHAHANVDETWRAIPIGEALQGLGSRIYKVFEDAEINTLGDLTDYQAKKGDFWVKDLAGVGPKAAEDIADASEAFWKRHKKQMASA
jgi:hypothetical protein